MSAVLGLSPQAWGVVIGASLFFVAVYYFLSKNEKQPTKNTTQPAPAKKKAQKVDVTAQFAAERKKKLQEEKENKEHEHHCLISSLHAHHEPLTSVQISPNSKFIATVAEDNTIRLWRNFNVPEHIPSNRVALDWDHATAVAFTPDSKFLMVATSNKKKVIFFRIHAHHLDQKDDGRPPREGQVKPLEFAHEFSTDHKSTINHIHMSQNMKYVWTSCTGEDTTIRAWTPKGEALAQVNSRQLINFSTALSPDSKLLIAGAKLEEARMWFMQTDKNGNLTAAQPVPDLRGNKKGVRSVVFSNDSTLAVCGTGDGCWRVFKVDVRYKDGEDPHLVSSHQSPLPTISFLQLSTSQQVVALAHQTTLVFCSLKTGQVIEKIDNVHRGAIVSMHMSADGHTLVTGGSLDKSAKVWRVPQA
eukprot:TRINITY_DN2569_c0_g1_i1.p1 TRINITY_DN2569_c0_g1~~TRINITY_DN2569_c0_g1_i1.p1  ORF type:complete len:415 (-),score=136.34 TRINITY_DN2569_c0_g1_i1:70-1314(-)